MHQVKIFLSLLSQDSGESPGYFHFFFSPLYILTALTHYCPLESPFHWSLFGEGYHWSLNCQIQWILKSLSYLISASFDTTPRLTFPPTKFTFYVVFSSILTSVLFLVYIAFLCSQSTLIILATTYILILSLSFLISLCICSLKPLFQVYLPYQTVEFQCSTSTSKSVYRQLIFHS